MQPELIPVSTSRKVYPLSLFDSNDPFEWETAYQLTMDPKYKKMTRNYSKVVQGKPVQDPKIYLIPRERGGPSYKDINLIGAQSEDVFFAPVSKGYPMQDVSSFTLGPVVGEGLCVVNAAFSKSICIFHIEGGGVVDYKRKTFWKPSRRPLRAIVQVDADHISVDGQEYNTFSWLDANRNLWFDEYNKWRKSVALCSNGDFHWTTLPSREDETIAYYLNDKFVSFVECKKKAYIEPAYQLIPKTDVYQFLCQIYHQNKISLGLVHPMAKKSIPEEPMTSDFITALYEDESYMCCMPYVVCGLLLGVPIDSK
jgi:hypothetical protein